MGFCPIEVLDAVQPSAQLAWARFRVEDGQATMQLQALTARTTLAK